VQRFARPALAARAPGRSRPGGAGAGGARLRRAGASPAWPA